MIPSHVQIIAAVRQLNASERGNAVLFELEGMARGPMSSMDDKNKHAFTLLVHSLLHGQRNATLDEINRELRE